MKFSIRIPNEIRDYQEKLVLGLNWRQLISSILALVVCIPLYLFCREYVGDDLAQWVIIIISIPLIGFGFINIHGMKFEILLQSVFMTSFIMRKKRNFSNNNFFRETESSADKEYINSVSTKKLLKYKKEAGLERTYLLEQAEKEGGFNMEKLNELDNELLTVSKPRVRENKKISRDDKEKTKRGNYILRILQKRIDQIEEKKKHNQEYIMNNQELFICKIYTKEVNKEKIREINQGKKTVNKKANQMKKRRNVKSILPKSTQDTLPYIADYDEGLFEVEPNKYSKCFWIQDINYLIGKDEEQIHIFEKWGEFINYFSEDIDIALSIDNRIISMNEQEQKVFYKLNGGDYDIHREEYNKILRKQIIAGNNDIQKQIYITITIDCENPYEAFLKFHRIQQEVINNIHAIGSSAKLMSTEERLQLLHDKMRKGKEGDLDIQIEDFKKEGKDFFEFLKTNGLSSKDYIAPSSFVFDSKDYFCIEDTYCRCMFLNNLPASLAMDAFHKMIKVNFPLLTTLHYRPISKDKAIKLIKRQLTGMEHNKMETEKKAVRNGYTPNINHDLSQSYEQALEIYDDIINKNQNLFFVTIGFMVTADSLDDLNEYCKLLISNARQTTCQIQTFDFQQENAFKVIMPMGISPKGKLFVERTLTTESAAVFTPFAVQELFQEGGFYYGLNKLSLNLILCDRTKMKTPSGFILGSSGSGKSFAAKREMLNVLLKDDETGILVIDPENEYTDFAKAFGGTILYLSASSDSYINPWDMNENYGLDEDDDPATISFQRKKDKALLRKQEFLMSILTIMFEENGVKLNLKHKSVIDTCIQKTYQTFLDNNFDQAYIPTFVEFKNEVDKIKDNNQHANDIAEGLPYFTSGSAGLFSHKSNLDFTNRFVVFSIRELGKELKELGLLITLDFIWNRMIKNCEEGLRTYCYADEVHILFKNDLSASYLQQLYKRGRKYGLIVTGITQDVIEILKSEIAKTMISNSKFILMLDQSNENLEELSKILKISETQMQYVTNTDEGCGLLFAEKVIIPFVDRFPIDSYLYTLMSTKFGEKTSGKDIKNLIAELRNKQKEKELLEQVETDGLSQAV